MENKQASHGDCSHFCHIHLGKGNEGGTMKTNKQTTKWKQLDLHRFIHCIILLQQRSIYVDICTHMLSSLLFFFSRFLGMEKQRLTHYTHTYLALYDKSGIFSFYPLIFTSFEIWKNLSFCKLSGVGFGSSEETHHKSVAAAPSQDQPTAAVCSSGSSFQLIHNPYGEGLWLYWIINEKHVWSKVPKNERNCRTKSSCGLVVSFDYFF